MDRVAAAADQRPPGAARCGGTVTVGRGYWRHCPPSSVVVNMQGQESAGSGPGSRLQDQVAREWYLPGPFPPGRRAAPGLGASAPPPPLPGGALVVWPSS